MPGPPSSIHGLPENVRETLHGWLNDPATSQKEAARRTNLLLAEVAPEHPGVSRHAINRYDQKYREATRQVRESREVASRMIADLGSTPGGEIGRLLTEMIRVVLLPRHGLHPGGRAGRGLDSRPRQAVEGPLADQPAGSRRPARSTSSVRARFASALAGRRRRRPPRSSGGQRPTRVSAPRQSPRSGGGFWGSPRDGACLSAYVSSMKRNLTSSDAPSRPIPPDRPWMSWLT